MAAVAIIGSLVAVAVSPTTASAAPPTITGEFLAPVRNIGSPVELSFRITNPNPFALTAVNFTVDLPDQLDLIPEISAVSCDPTPTKSTSIDRLAITDGTIPANSNCSLFVYAESSVSTGGTLGAGPGFDYAITLSDLTTNQTGTTPPPDIGTFTFINPSAVAPGPPTNATATAGAGKATVTWSAPATNGGAFIHGYRIEQSANAGATWTTKISDTGTTSTTAVVSALAIGVPVEFRVRAVNDVGIGSPSNSTGQVTPFVLPSAPHGASAIAGDSTAVITWTAPFNDGGSPITGYRIEQSTNNGTSWGIAIADSGTPFSVANVFGLANGTPIEFRIRAINAGGTGAPSASTGQITPFGLPGTPTNPTAPVSDSAAVVSWTAPASDGGSRITGYRVEQPTNGTTWSIAIANTGLPFSVANLYNLANGTPIDSASAPSTPPASATHPLPPPRSPRSRSPTRRLGSAALRATPPPSSTGLRPPTTADRPSPAIASRSPPTTAPPGPWSARTRAPRRPPPPSPASPTAPPSGSVSPQSTPPGSATTL
jgi:hypothetical protein